MIVKFVKSFFQSDNWRSIWIFYIYITIINILVDLVIFFRIWILAIISSSPETATAVITLLSKSINDSAGSFSWTTFWFISHKWWRSSINPLKFKSSWYYWCSRYMNGLDNFQPGILLTIQAFCWLPAWQLLNILKTPWCFRFAYHKHWQFFVRCTCRRHTRKSYFTFFTPGILFCWQVESFIWQTLVK